MMIIPACIGSFDSFDILIGLGTLGLALAVTGIALWGVLCWLLG